VFLHSLDEALQENRRGKKTMRTIFASLVFFLISISGLRALPQEQPTITRGPAQRTDPTSGVAMYGAHCAVCHGLDGKGNGPAAPALKQPPSDLTQLSKRSGGKFPDFRVANVIQGDSVIPAHGGKEMPIWGDVFRSVQRDDAIVKLRVHNLTEYIASFQQN
jgi:mono/diheme cytochrome c family protein